jgi:hypothetical protein
VGAVTAGVWTLFNYRRAQRAEAARWLQGVFRDFYLDDRFRDIKLVMEYHHVDRLGPLLERRVTDAHVPVSDDDQVLLEQLDMGRCTFDERSGCSNRRLTRGCTSTTSSW